MHLFASLVAWLHAAALLLLVTWPFLADLPFPVPGWRSVQHGPALAALAVAAIALAVCVNAFWRQVRERRMVFSILAMACFLHAALFISVSVGFNFAVVAVLIRSR